MAVTVQLDPALSSMTGGATTLTVEGSTVREAMVQVARTFPSLRLINCEGEMRGIMKVLRNGSRADLAEPLHDGDTLLLTVK